MSVSRANAVRTCSPRWPYTTCRRSGRNARAVSSTCASIGRPASGSNTLGNSDFMRLPSPAARTITCSGSAMVRSPVDRATLAQRAPGGKWRIPFPPVAARRYRQTKTPAKGRRFESAGESVLQVAPQPLQRLQLRDGLGELFLRLLHGLGVAAVLQHALGLFLGAPGGSLVDFVGAQCGVGQHRHHIRLHLEDAAGYVVRLTLAILADHLDLARLETRQQRLVARRDAQLAGFAAGDDQRRFAVEDIGFGTDDVTTDGGHFSLALLARWEAARFAGCKEEVARCAACKGSNAKREVRACSCPLLFTIDSLPLLSRRF